FFVSKVLKVLRVQLDLLARPVLEAVPLGLLVQPDLQEQQAQLELLVQQVLWVPRELKDLPDLKVLSDSQDQLAPQEPSDRLGRQEPLVLPVQRVLLVPLVRQDLEALMLDFLHLHLRLLEQQVSWNPMLKQRLILILDLSTSPLESILFLKVNLENT